VGVEKTFGDVVRVFVVIDMFVMAAMIACPHEHGILECSGAKNEREQTHGQFRPKSHVRKKPVITQRDAEPGGSQQDGEHGELEPINAEIPQVKRHCCQRQKDGADQERTCRPIDAVCWDTENHGKKKLGGFKALSGIRSSENNVLFCPGMDPAAMRAGELLCFHFGRRPALFFYCPAGIGQL
jgi:hypothetical protein